MKRKNLLYTICIATFIFTMLTLKTNAQSPNWLWAKGAEGSSWDIANSVTADGNGNKFVVGHFGSATLTFGSFTLTNAGSDDMFFVKYCPKGNCLWAKKMGGNISEGAFSVTADASGNIFVAGWFSSSTITFGSFTLTNAGGDDMFHVKYDPNGIVLWAKRAGGSEQDAANSVIADGAGNTFVAGSFYSSTIIFGSFTLTNSSAGYNDMFLVKYDANGNVIWAKSAVGNHSDGALSITAEASGNIYVAGYFGSSTISFGIFTLTNASTGVEMFVAKYDSDGNAIWAKSAWGRGNDGALSITSDASGNTFVVGRYYSTTLKFDSITLINAGDFDLFLVKYDTDGNAIWAKSGGGNLSDGAYSVTAEASGNIVVAGRFDSPSITFGPFSLTNTNAGYGDIFIANYDNNGNVLWAKSAGGSKYEWANSVTADASGNIFVAGWFASSTITFGSIIINNSGSEDVFVAKLSSITGIESTEVQNGISIYPNPSNGKFIVEIKNVIEQKINQLFEIYNMFGEKVFQSQISNPLTEINRNLSSGIYFYRVRDSKKSISSGKIIIQ